MKTEIISVLTGCKLADDWVIEAPRSRMKGATGACHSLAFTARHADGHFAFVKILDPTPDENLPEDEQLIDLERRVAIFRYEQELLEKCLNRRIRRVVRALGHGTFRIPGFPIPVRYLMFELAERDLREHATLEHTLNTAMNLRILHQVALGLEALHFNQIAHQDIKPSNVLLFSELVTKIGDLGNAHDKGIPRPGNDHVIVGDPGHASPDQLFGYRANEWNERRLSTDLYLLGSLIVFMFTNVSMTTQIAGNLLPQHHWEAWPGTYTDALPYVRDAWNAVLEDLAGVLDDDIRDEVVQLTRWLTNPDPAQRGHPHNRAGSGSPFGVRRFSSRLHVLATKVECRIRTRTAA